MEQEAPELGRTARIIADIRAQEGLADYAYQQYGEWKGSEAGRAVKEAEICNKN